MLFKVALVPLIAWVLGMLGVFNAGRPVHILLLSGLLLVLMAVVKGRDAAAVSERRAEPPSGRK